jgi:hypothetical protein
MRWRNQLGPWVITIVVAVLFGWSLTLSGFKPENRPLPQFQAHSLSGGADVSNATLAGKPAIINIWAPT